MNLDFPESIDVLRTEPVKIGDRKETVYAQVIDAGDPVSGGAIRAQQKGEQYTLRFLKTEYPDPALHDSLKTQNFGTLKMKQAFSEGKFWACLSTGSVRGGRDI
jgi:hypothetical protein